MCRFAGSVHHGCPSLFRSAATCSVPPSLPSLHALETPPAPEGPDVLPVLKVLKPPVRCPPDPHHVEPRRLRTPRTLPQVCDRGPPQHPPLAPADAPVRRQRIRLRRPYPHLHKHHHTALPHHQVQLAVTVTPAPVQQPHPLAVLKVTPRHPLTPLARRLTRIICHPTRFATPAPPRQPAKHPDSGAHNARNYPANALDKRSLKPVDTPDPRPSNRPGQSEKTRQRLLHPGHHRRTEPPCNTGYCK
jgi:hypothetical protein